MNYNSENAMLCYDLLESELGGNVHGAPTSWLGACVRSPPPPCSAADGTERLTLSRSQHSEHWPHHY